MGQSHSGAASNHSTVKELLTFLRNPKADYDAHKISLPIPSPTHMTPVHTALPYLSEIILTLPCHLCLDLLSESLTLKFCDQNLPVVPEN
jgi:hypothetical protein